MPATGNRRMFCRRNYLKMDLKPIPSTPCGVSSHSNAPQSRIAPINFHSEKKVELKRFSDIVAQLPGCVVKVREDDYLHIVCKRWFLFVDDMEVLWSEADDVFHVRSVTRFLPTDFGANRTRVELARNLFDKGYLY